MIGNLNQEDSDLFINNITPSLISQYEEVVRGRYWWDEVFSTQLLSDEFIDRFKNKMYWGATPSHSVITNPFLNKMPLAQRLLILNNGIGSRDAKEYLSPEYYKIYLNYKDCKELIE